MELMDEKYTISEEFYNAVKRSLRGYYNDPELVLGEVDSRTYTGYIDILKGRVDSIVKWANSYYKNIAYEPDLLSKIQELGQEYLEIKSNIKISKDERNKKIAELATEIVNTNYIMNVLFDLRRVKEDYETDLKYYSDVDSLKDWNERFESAFKERNIDKIVSILNELKELNKQAIGNFVNDKTDDDFAFIGHSLCSSNKDFRGVFWSNFTSASLFTSEFNDTFHNGYGYILSSSDIVSATPWDSNTRNKADNLEDLIAGTSVPRICHPQKIIEGMREHRKQNEENVESISEKESLGSLPPIQRVYSEIVLEGLHPIGIFCFTNGLKEFDSDYEDALELRKNNPDLELRIIDTLKYKKGIALEVEKFRMLSHIQYKLEKDYGRFPILIGDLPLYDYFFTKFDELKAKGDYTSKDIEELYKKTKELRMVEPIHLFKYEKDYTEEEIKFILGKGFYFKADIILSGKATAIEINRLADISRYVVDEKCKSLLDKYYPGLAEFSVLVKKVNVTKEMYEKMKQESPLTFSNMNKYLYKIVKEKIAEEQVIIDQKVAFVSEEKKRQMAELTKKQIALQELYKRKEQLENEEQKYLTAQKITYSEFELSIIELDVDSANTKKDNYHLLKAEKEEELAVKESEKEGYFAKKTEQDKQYEILCKELNELKQHPFINRKKIKAKEQEISEFNANTISPYGEIYMYDLNSYIDRLKFDISNYESDEQESVKTLEDAKLKLKELFGTEDLDEAKRVVENARSIVESYNSDYLFSIKMDIDNLLLEIERKEEQIRKLETEEENLRNQKPNTL